MSAPVVLVGTTVDDAIVDVALHKYNHVGGVYPHGHRTAVPGSLEAISGVALDASGQQYGCGSSGAAGYTTFGMSPNGDLRWTANHQADVWGLALDEDNGRLYTVGTAVNASGAIYPDSVWEGGGITGTRTGYYTTRAYSLATGALVWSADHGFSYRASRMAITYGQGRVYTSGEGRETGDGGDTGGNLTCYDADTGEILWSAGKFSAGGYGFVAFDLITDASDALYVAGIFTSDAVHYGLLKFSSTGVWAASAAALINASGGRIPMYGLAWSQAGELIVASAPVLYDETNEYYKTLHRYDDDLVFIASNAGNFDRLIAAGGLAVDADDRVYIVGGHWRGIGQRTQNTLTCVDLAAVFATNVDNDWDWELSQTDSSSESIDAYSIAVREVETPPLRLQVALAIPTWQGDLYSLIPGLPAALALAVPYLLREYVGLPQPEIYRLFLTGTPNLELPLSSFSHRATATGIRLDVVSPGSTSAIVAAVEARASGDLVLYRGVRLSAGGQQLEELARAALESVRYDEGGDSASLSLGGVSAWTATHVKPRVLRGISYRAETGGVRRVRCAVDPYLRVGDTADLGGGESLIVSSITITVSSTQAVMEIAE